MGIFDKVVQEIIEDGKQGTIEAAKDLLQDANQVVPVKTGKLKDSGHVEITQTGADVVYDTEYAILVHEDPESKGYKWLERTLDQNEEKYIGIIGGGK